MKIITIIGARPQFIKASALSKEIANQNNHNIEDIIVHTGQHFDFNMSEVFFSELGIPKPKYNLKINGLSHGAMTGQMLEGIEDVLNKENPDVVVVYGDTNSTLSGALAAAKLNIPVAHIESGLRSNNMFMPEELNRILTDRLSSILFCSSLLSIENLTSEGFPFKVKSSLKQEIIYTGDIMYDVVKNFRDNSSSKIDFSSLGIEKNNYVLLTAHRQETIDNTESLSILLDELEELSNLNNIVFPIHPRTKNAIYKNNLEHKLKNLILLEPLGYLEMHSLIKHASKVITDSGGLQKEAYFHKVPCITIRDETEWKETIDLGWNILSPPKDKSLVEIFNSIKQCEDANKMPYGNGDAAKIIIEKLIQIFN